MFPALGAMEVSQPVDLEFFKRHVLKTLLGVNGIRKEMRLVEGDTPGFFPTVTGILEATALSPCKWEVCRDPLSLGRAERKS